MATQRKNLFPVKPKNDNDDDAPMKRMYSITSMPGEGFSRKASTAILCTFLACMTNVVFLEHIIKIDPTAGTLVTFCQFTFVSIAGCLTWWQFGKRTNQVPMKRHLVLVALFWSVNFANNLAFKFSIPMTLHTIFRSGSLASNMFMGVILMKKSYRTDKYVSVIFISIGILLCTLMSTAGKSAVSKTSEEEAHEFSEQVTGISLLTFALIVSSGMGLIQEKTYAEHGKHPSEALFINHVLGLPLFYFSRESIITAFNTLLNTEPVNVTNGVYPDWNLPIGIVYLIINCLTSYACIRSVFILTTECTSLTVTLVITVRKFMTLLVSIFYFKNSFSYLHWVGTGMVFLGTAVYADLVPLPVGLFEKKKVKKEQ